MKLTKNRPQLNHKPKFYTVITSNAIKTKQSTMIQGKHEWDRMSMTIDRTTVRRVSLTLTD